MRSKRVCDLSDFLHRLGAMELQTFLIERAMISLNKPYFVGGDADHR